MTSEWRYRLYLFLPAAAATVANKRALARVYSDNGSGETLEDELKMFDAVVRLSTTGVEPAQAFGLALPAKLTMRDLFVSFIGKLPEPYAWAVVANTTLPNYADGELIALSPNLPQGAIGQVATWEQALGFIETKYGLRVIPPPDPIAGETTRLTGSVRAVNLLGRVPVPAYTTEIGERIWDTYTGLVNRLRGSA